jgi:hypothetical protein
MERLARLLGCVLLASLCVEAMAATVKVAELTGAVRKGDGVAVDLTSTLNSGDRVLANSPDASVLLECTGGATQMLDNGFDAIIDGTGGDGSACAIDLKQGTAVATTAPNGAQNTGASIKAGDVTLGARGTQFGASVGPESAGAADLEAFVIEGDVEVSGLTEVKWLKTSQSVRRSDRVVKSINEARYEYLASSYARLTTSRSNGATAQTEELKNMYLRSFRNPADADARVMLAKSMEVGPDSALQKYQHARAGVLTAAVGVNVNAMMKVVPKHNGYRVDVCKVWGMECGQPAADEWCRRRGKQRARSYAIEQNIGATQPTVVIATGQLCKDAYCDAFSRIACE